MPPPIRVALVTGSSSGIGQACCERLSRRGWRVYGGSRTAPAGTAWPQLTIDVRQDGAMEAAVGQIVDREGRLDALVHCAGASLAGSIEDTTLEEAKGLFETNYFGTVRAVRAVLPAMRAAKAGRIVIIGSIAGRIGLPFLGHYSASKFAAEGFVEALRLEIAPFGIEATLVHPGDTKTAIVAHETRGQATGATSVYLSAFATVSKIYAANIEKGMPPDQVAKAVAAILDKARPPVTALVGKPAETAAVALKARLPSRWFAFVVRKACGL